MKKKYILNKMSLKVITKGPIDNDPTLVIWTNADPIQEAYMRH